MLIFEIIMVAMGAVRANLLRSVLTTLGIEPPELSGWEWGLASERMRKV